MALLDPSLHPLLISVPLVAGTIGLLATWRNRRHISRGSRAGTRIF
jgi:hypothetical protein